MTDTTTIEQQLADLKPGETLVVLTRDDNGSYWLGVGDARAANEWYITPAELEKIVELGARHLGWEIRK